MTEHPSKAFVDVLGRPLRPVLNPGDTLTVKGAQFLLGESIAMRQVIRRPGLRTEPHQLDIA